MFVRSLADWLVDMSYGAYACRANQPFGANVWGDSGNASPRMRYAFYISFCFVEVGRVLIYKYFYVAETKNGINFPS